MSDPLRDLPEFVAAVEARLERGRREYGDRSFGAPPDDLMREIAEECLDLACWGYVLWCRVEGMRRMGR